jgi:PAS domain S-box-containing protein
MTRTDSNRYASLSQTAERLFVGGGSMGALMHAFDWAASPLGPIEDWPPSLHTVVRLCLISHFPTVIFWGPELRMLYNDAYLPILADKHPASLGRPVREVWPEIWSIIGPMLEGVFATGEATWSENLLLPILDNGTTGAHYFTFSYAPIQNETGQVCGVFCPVTETTERVERKRREQALRHEAEAAHARVRTTLESITDGFYTVDHDWRFTYVNQRAKAVWGREQDDFLGKSLGEEFPDAMQNIFGAHLREAIARQVTTECEGYYAPLGMWITMRAYPSSEGLAVYFQDITARKQAEAALQASEARLQLALRSAHLGVHDWNPVTGELHWDEQVRALWGLRPGAPVNYETFLAGIHPEDRAAVQAAVDRALNPQGDGQYNAEFRVIGHEDGVQRWIVATGQVFFEYGHAVRLLGTTLDITPASMQKASPRPWCRPLAMRERR